MLGILGSLYIVLLGYSVKISHMVNKKESKTTFSQAKPQRLTDKAMRQLLTDLKKEADKTPEEKGSFSLEVICSGKDMQGKKK